MIIRSDATLEQLANVLPGISSKVALSRTLRKDHVPDAFLVDNIVRRCAAWLDVPERPLLEEFRTLHHEAEAAAATGDELTPPRPETGELEAFLRLVWSGEAELAAEHLSARYADDLPAAARLLVEVGTRDPGGVAMVVQALARQATQKHADDLLQALRNLDQDVADQVAQIPPPPPEASPVAEEEDSGAPPSITDLDPLIGISHRWVAQIGQGKADQVARELVARCTPPVPASDGAQPDEAIAHWFKASGPREPGLDIEQFTDCMVAVIKNNPADEAVSFSVLWSALVCQGQTKALADLLLRADVATEGSRRAWVACLTLVQRPDVLAVFNAYKGDGLSDVGLAQLQTLMPALPRALSMAVMEAWERHDNDLAGRLFPALCRPAAEFAFWLDHDLELTARLMSRCLRPQPQDSATDNPAYSALPQPVLDLAQTVVDLIPAAPDHMLPLLSTLLVNYPSETAELMFAMEAPQLAEGTRAARPC